MQSKEKVKSLHLGLTRHVIILSQTSGFKRSDKQTSLSSIGQSPIIPREFFAIVNWSATKLIPAIKVVAAPPPPRSLAGKGCKQNPTTD